MTELTSTERDRMIVEMHTLLCDTNGNEGLCSQFRKHREEDQRFRRIFYSFRLWVIVTAALILGGGGIGYWKAADVLAQIAR